MQNPKWFSTFLKIVLVAVSIWLLVVGGSIVIQWQTLPVYTSSAADKNWQPASDSTVSNKKTVVDTARKSTVTEDRLVIYRTQKTEPCNTCFSTMKENMLKKGYDFIFLGIMLILTALILPHISQISILSLFTASFREKIESSKALFNSVTNNLNTNIPPTKPETVESDISLSHLQGIREILPEHTVQDEKIIKYATDPQKGKWGKSEFSNDRQMVASVTPLQGTVKLFKVAIRVISTSTQKPLSGKVIFHLHPSFPNPDPEIYVVQGQAVLELISWGAFTVGAEIEGEPTKLELDLSALIEAPLIFKTT